MLELGERFLPRPTTTLTKRRLYCWSEGGKGEEGKDVSVNVAVWIVNPNIKKK